MTDIGDTKNFKANTQIKVCQNPKEGKEKRTTKTLFQAIQTIKEASKETAGTKHNKNINNKTNVVIISLFLFWD